MPDQNPLPDSGGGGMLSGDIAGIPKWMFAAGVVGVLAFLYLRHRSQSSSGSSALQGPIGGQVTPQTAGGAVDPFTGQMIDPFTGQPYTAVNASGTSSQQSLSDWIAAAEKALVTAGYSPAAIAQALYDYTNGNQLTNQEAGIINKALGLVGFPPVNLPFLGTPPPPQKQKPPPKPPVPIGPGHHFPVPTQTGNGTKLVPLPSPPERLLAQIDAAGAHLIGSIKTPQYGNGAGYYFSSNGGVFAVGGAPFLGSYFSLPQSVRNVPNRMFQGFQLLPGGGYVLISSTGERYNFPKPTPKKRKAG